MKQNIQVLKIKIESGQFPVSYNHFAGTGLIITDNKEYTGGEGDIVICTLHAGALSWLVFQLKHIFQANLDHSRKCVFYHQIGTIIQSKFKSDGDLMDVMLMIVDEMYAQFSEKVIVKKVPF